jgi:ABC-type multidrug transport system fused ATPase/permease subunit
VSESSIPPLAALLRRESRALAAAAALLAVGAALPAAGVFVVRHALANLTSGDTLSRACAALLGIAVLQAALTLGRAALTRRAGASIASSLRRQLHARWLESSEGFVGDRLAGLLDEVDHVQYAVSAWVGLIRDPLVVAGLAAAAIWLAPMLALPAAIVGVPVVLAAVAGGRLVRRAAGTARQARADLARLTAEQLAAVDLLRAYGAQRDENDRFARADTADRRARVRLDLVRLLPSSLVQVLAAAAVATLLLLGGRYVAAGRLALPDLVAFVAALVLLARPLANVAESVALLHRSRAALERVEASLATPPPIRIATGAVPDGPLTLAWQAVTVRVADRVILDEVTLTAEPGTIVAVAGRTGAGKTTLLHAAAGLRGCDEGRILIGGVPIDEVPLGALRRALAIVQQDTILFARSVAENVALGEVPDPERVERALREAGAEFVLDLPQGIGTVLAERGRGWSGGERQRIGLARALYRGTRVLLLDEPTSQVDEGQARRFGEVLRALAPGRTIVVAAHDPVLWRAADRLLTLPPAA